MHQGMKARLAVAAVGVALLAGGCSGSASDEASSNGGGDSEALRIGVTAPQTGPYALYGKEQIAGVQFAVDQANANGGVDGRKVELKIADDLGTAEGAIAVSQRMTQRDGIKFLTGMVSSPEIAAVAPKLESLGAVMIGVQALSNDFTGKDCTPNFFRTTMSARVDMNGIAAFMKDHPEIKEWDTLGADYSFGQDSAAGVKAVAEELGVKVNKQLLAPLGTTDFGSYISQLTGRGGLIVANAGSDAVSFFKQAKQFGLLEKYDLVMSDAGMHSSVLEAIGDPSMEGVWATTNWEPRLDSEANVEFVKAYTEKVGTPPTTNVGNSYVAMQFLFAAVTKAKSVDPLKVREAMNGLTFDSINGELTMSADDHQIKAPMYVAQVTKGEDGKLGLDPSFVVPASVNNPEPDPACNMK